MWLTRDRLLYPLFLLTLAGLAVALPLPPFLTAYATITAVVVSAWWASTSWDDASRWGFRTQITVFGYLIAAVTAMTGSNPAVSTAVVFGFLAIVLVYFVVHTLAQILLVSRFSADSARGRIKAGYRRHALLTMAWAMPVAFLISPNLVGIALTAIFTFLLAGATSIRLKERLAAENAIPAPAEEEGEGKC